MTSNTKDEEGEDDKFTAGEDVQFDYTTNPGRTINKKKKKKKNKNKKSKSKSPISVETDSVEAVLMNPEDDYPTERIIRSGSNGEVIVEKIQELKIDENLTKSKKNKKKNKKNIWNAKDVDHDDVNVLKFWDNLPNDKKIEICSFDDESFMNDLKRPQKKDCSCKYCTLRSFIVKHEVNKLKEEFKSLENLDDFVQTYESASVYNVLKGSLADSTDSLDFPNSNVKREHLVGISKTIAEKHLKIQMANQKKEEEHQKSMTKSDEEKIDDENSKSNDDKSDDSSKIEESKSINEDQKTNQEPLSVKTVFENLMPSVFKLGSSKENSNKITEVKDDESEKHTAPEVEESDDIVTELSKDGKLKLNFKESALRSIADDLLQNDGKEFVEIMEKITKVMKGNESDSRFKTELHSLLDQCNIKGNKENGAELEKFYESISSPEYFKSLSEKLNSTKLSKFKELYEKDMKEGKVLLRGTKYETVEYVSSKHSESHKHSHSHHIHSHDHSLPHSHSHSHSLSKDQDEEDEDNEEYFSEDFESDEDDEEDEDEDEYDAHDHDKKSSIGDGENGELDQLLHYENDRKGSDSSRQEIRNYVGGIIHNRILAAYKLKVAEDKASEFFNELAKEEEEERLRKEKKQKLAEEKREKKRKQQAAKAEEQRRKEELKKEEEERKKEEQRKKTEEGRKRKEEERKRKEEELRKKNEEKRKLAEKKRKKEEELKKKKEEELKKKKEEEWKKKKEEESRKKKEEEDIRKRDEELKQHKILRKEEELREERLRMEEELRKRNEEENLLLLKRKQEQERNSRFNDSIVNPLSNNSSFSPTFSQSPFPLINNDRRLPNAFNNEVYSTTPNTANTNNKQFSILNSNPTSAASQSPIIPSRSSQILSNDPILNNTHYPSFSENLIFNDGILGNNGNKITTPTTPTTTTNTYWNKHIQIWGNNNNNNNNDNKNLIIDKTMLKFEDNVWNAYTNLIKPNQIVGEEFIRLVDLLELLKLVIPSLTITILSNGISQLASTGINNKRFSYECSYDGKRVIYGIKMRKLNLNSPLFANSQILNSPVSNHCLLSSYQNNNPKPLFGINNNVNTGRFLNNNNKNDQSLGNHYEPFNSLKHVNNNNQENVGINKGSINENGISSNLSINVSTTNNNANANNNTLNSLQHFNIADLTSRHNNSNNTNEINKPKMQFNSIW